MQNEDFKGELNQCYREETPPITACAVTTEIPEIFLFSTHRNHDGSMSPNGKGHIILKKVFHWYNNLEISEVPKHTQQSYQSRYHQVMKTFTKDKKKSQLPLKS